MLPETHALVLRARHLGEQASEESLARAEELYREALAIDSTYAAGWTGLALNYIGQSRVAGYADALPRAGQAAERALANDPNHARAHSILGDLARARGDLTVSARHHERALTLAPGDAWIVGRAGLMPLTLGRLDEAIRLLEYRVARDPVSAGGHINLGLAYSSARRWGDAVEALRTARELGPDVAGVHAFLGQALVRAGEPEAGLAAIREERAEGWRLMAEAMVHHTLGRPDVSDSTLAALIDSYEQDSAFNIAYVVAHRGEVDRAFTWLDRAVSYEDPGLSEIFLFPEFDVLEDDPRWPAFLERIGMAPGDLEAIEFEVELPEGTYRGSATS